MASANAQIGIAYAAYFPTLTLSGQNGFASSQFSTLFNASNHTWSIGPSVSETIFDAGLRGATVRQNVATYNADLAAYRPVWRRPLLTGYRGHQLATNPPPSSGGSLVAYMLAVLDGTSARLAPGEARTLLALAETMRAAARTRDARFERLLHRGGLPRSPARTACRPRATESRASRWAPSPPR